MSILCKLFGHRPNGSRYLLFMDGVSVDGGGRQTFTLRAACQRCGRRFQIGHISGDQVDTQRWRNGLPWETK